MWTYDSYIGKASCTSPVPLSIVAWIDLRRLLAGDTPPACSGTGGAAVALDGRQRRRTIAVPHLL